MSTPPGGGPKTGTRFATASPLLMEVVAPLAVFYGLRALGAGQVPALLAGLALTAVRGVQHMITERRVSGVTLFVMMSMGLTVAMSFVTGSPRLLLLRNGWGTAALGIGMLLTVGRRRPALYEATRLVLDRDGQHAWARSWEQYPAFRSLLRTCTAVWGVACLVDAAVRVAMALTLPVDLVPLLDDVLLGVTLVALLAFQRSYGRRYLRRHGLRRDGAHVTPYDDRPAPPASSAGHPTTPNPTR